MNQYIYICEKPSLEQLLVDVIADSFRLDPSILPSQISRSLKLLINSLRDDLWFLVESPYVDKIYRDSYYMYYSSKYGRYSRDCIKVSLFEGKIESSDYRSLAGYDKLKPIYLGFFVIRPTEPAFLGRNVISPRAFTLPAIEYCSFSQNSTVNGLKFEIQGFPHSSQDSETYSCAETTIWSIMEYFGSKYADYRPVKPSQILEVLKKMAYERQIPSLGLSIHQISYVLKELGFGCKIYSVDQYGDDFFRMLSSYVESGIPIVIGMDDFHDPKSKNIGHAVLIIGRTKIAKSDYLTLATNNHLNSRQSTWLNANNIEFYDFDDLEKDYIFIDDNQPPYQIATASSPVKHYSTDWQNVKIKNFVVPLYPKIYLEAFEARNFIKEFLLFGPFPLQPGQNVFMKFYLTSSRSFKHSISLSEVQDDLKNFIVEKPMPKFVWIAELAEKDMFVRDQRNGLVVIDATEPNISDNKPLIVAAYQDNVIFFDGINDILTKMALPLQPFNLFLNNLTPSEI